MAWRRRGSVPIGSRRTATSLHVEPGRLVLADGDVAVGRDAVVVRCAASGLQYPPSVPIWDREAINVQPIRLGFLCFGAALAGYVEATLEDDAEKNCLCPPAPFSDTPTDWARQQVLGARASLTSQPNIRDRADAVSLNPARISPEMSGSAAVIAAKERLSQHVGPGMTKLAEMV